MDSQLLEFISWFFVAIALWGSVYNSMLNQIYAFRLWFVSNLFFIGFNLYFGHYGAAALYACHWVLSIAGLYNISKNNR